MKEEYKGTTKLYSRCTEVEAVVLANGEYPTASLPCIYWKAPLMWFVATAVQTNTSGRDIFPILL